MGEQLYAVVFKRRVSKKTKTGRTRETWERGYRAPRPEDDVSALVAERLAEKLPDWEALDIVPSEILPQGNKTTEPMRYGMTHWRDLFSPRQLLGHGTSVEIFRELLDEEQAKGTLTEATKAAFGYLALAIDKLLNWNAIISSWNVEAQRLRSVFDRHDYALKWSFGEMAPLIVGLGYDWAIKQTAKCVEELIELARPDLAPSGNGGNGGQGGLALGRSNSAPSSIEITCKPADALDHIADGSIDAVVIDPPYYANVMCAELSDFFYVWLKRTAGYVYPEWFRRPLTDKENEAVANVAKFKGHKGALRLAGKDYQQRMAAIFAECRRVLKPEGIMTVMFTHKDNAAWDALTKGMMEAGFVITASWPINTEAEGSLHIKDKAAANSTIFLVCRPRELAGTNGSGVFWEDIEPLVAKAVRRKVAEFAKAGIKGVDLYLACFGPALEEFSRHWPLRRGQPRPMPKQRRARAQQELLEEEFDPYAATPEDALEAARREVKQWRLEQLTRRKARVDLDPLTAWFVLAWDAFEAPQFSFDEALRLARVCGIDIEADVVGTLAEKKGSDLILWDSGRRAAKARLGPADGSRAMLDALHHAAYAARQRTLAAARELLEQAGVAGDLGFLTALEAVLEVLPVSKTFTGIDEASGLLAEAASDFDALEMLRRLAFTNQIDEPTQLGFWKDQAA
jgi:putative DNA methylase